MSITNGYCTLDDLKAEMRITVNDLTDDARMETAIAAASRQIDAYCGRRFWQDATVVAREFTPDGNLCVDVDDISTATGLVVKLDDSDDGTFETTVSDYRLMPRNAAAETPVRPYTAIELRADSPVFFPTGYPSVQVTARFGWPAVPDDVTKACLIQSAMLFKSADAVFGVTEFANSGVAMRVRSSLNPIAEALLEPYVKGWVG